MNELNFEALRDEIEALAVPVGHVRHLRWVTTSLAIGRAMSGDYEIFLRGPELRASSALVRRHMQHAEWRPEEGGEAFPASRIALPSAPHFASIATLIATELLRAGVAEAARVQVAFSDVEPIIEMAIRRGALSENVIVGLVGELMLLRHMVLARQDDSAKLLRTLDYWQGWQEGARDFRIGGNSIEVKTTRSTSSIHEFSGLHQLEGATLPSGDDERLHVMSIGLAPSTTIGETLPEVVASLASMLSFADNSTLADEFFRRVGLYGRQSGASYNHPTMKTWAVYGTRYAHTFTPRLYHLDDAEMRLLTRQTLSQTFVQAEGLSFTMHFPESISAFNPAPNWQAEIEAMENFDE